MQAFRCKEFLQLQFGHSSAETEWLCSHSQDIANMSLGSQGGISMNYTCQPYYGGPGVKSAILQYLLGRI